MTVSIKILC